jgi:hypothetical protein
MLYALYATGQMGCNRVIFVTDSVVPRQAMTSEEYNRALLGALFQEIKFQLKKIVFGAVNLVVCRVL